MAYSYNVYTGNGSTTQFTIGFPYIRREHVKVYVAYVDTAYTYVNNTTVQLAAAPGAGIRVEVRRVTPFASVLVDFADGSTLVAADLDTSNLQHLYLEQELDDNDKQAIYIDPASGQLTAGGQQIKNVADPTAAQDAATKAYTDTQDALRLKRDGTQAMTGALPMGGFKVTGLGTPTANADAVTKSYLDAYINTAYLGPLASDPAVRPSGGALQAGDIYFNTTQNILKTYTGSIWVISAAAGNIVRWRKTASAGNTTLSGVDDLGVTLSYVVGNEQVYLNGALQTRGVDYTAGTGTSITLTPALLAGDVVELHAVQGYVSATITPGSINDALVAPAAGIQATKLAFTQSGTGATARTIDSKLKDVVSVKDFGAVGDGVANDAPAFQAAINSGAKCIRIPAPTVKYLLTQSLNMTGLRGIKFEFESSLDINIPQILAKHTGAVFDLTGAFDCCFVNANVEGDATTTPTCMFLLARNSTNASAARHRFFNPRSLGKFSAAVVYNYGSEENDFYSPCFIQTAAGKPCVYLTATNAASLTSSFATISTGVQSTTVLRFFGGSYYAQGNSGSENETCFTLNGVADVTISDPFMYCPYGKSYVFVDTTTSGSALVNIKGARGEVSATLPQHGIYFNSGAAVFCANWSVKDSRFPVDSNVIYAEDSTTLAGLQYSSITAQTGNAINAKNLQDCFIDHQSSLVTGRAGGAIQRNVFVGYEVNRTLSGTNTTNTFINTNEGSLQTNGIKFPASQVASANVNTLDDYEEGVFTPVLTCGTPGNLAITYGTQAGFYTKIGRLVTVHIEIGTATFTHTTASSLVFITGLPFVPAQANFAAFSSWGGFTSANYTFLGAQISSTVSNVYVNKSGSGQAFTVALITDFPTGGTVQLYSNFSYLAAT
jgi:hypothetical protein